MYTYYQFMRKKPFNCNICNASFTQTVHEGKNLKRSICTIKLARRTRLNAYIESNS